MKLNSIYKLKNMKYKKYLLIGTILLILHLSMGTVLNSLNSNLQNYDYSLEQSKFNYGLQKYREELLIEKSSNIKGIYIPSTRESATIRSNYEMMIPNQIPSWIGKHTLDELYKNGSRSGNKPIDMRQLRNRVPWYKLIMDDLGNPLNL